MELIDYTLGGILEKWVREQPDHEFMIYPDRGLRFSYKEFDERVDIFAKGLLAIGVRKGSKVGVWAKNVPDWMTLMFATAKIGAVLVTVNTNYKAAELEYIMKNADIHTMCMVNGYRDSDYVQILYDLVPELKTLPRGHLHSERFPELRNVVYIGQEKQRGMYNTSELMTLGSLTDDAMLSEAKAQVGCHDEINMQYTSGTTGFPKGVMLTSHNILNNGQTIGDCMHFTPADRLLICVPLFHCFGCVLGVCSVITHGSTMVMVEDFDPLKVLASVHRERCTALHGVPTMFIAELNQMARETLDREFMIDFLQDIAHALQYSSQQAAKSQQAAVDTLRSALKVYQQKPLNEGECKEALHKSAAAVEAAIDKLQLDKDNQAYVYRSGAQSYIDRYARSKTHNPKEEKRYAREQKKFEAQKAKGKNPPSVIPKNLIDADMAQHNLCEMTQSLLKHFEELIAASETKDFDVLAVEMVDYMKARAQDYAFKLTKGMARHRAIELMKEVGIPEPHKRFYQYPFEFSGGMRQRIVIAIALSANPDILICDEPTTALDVTIQAQILELINRLKKERRLSVIFITHDLGVVANMADRIAIMYAGKIVEYGTADDVFYDPRHPYTWALLSSMPDLETREKLEAIPGTPPDMILPPKGDAFAARNKYAMEIDFEEQPPMFHVSETHMAATWLLHPNAPKVNPPAIVVERIERMKKEQAEREAAEALQNAKKGAAEA